jgi:UDP-N-acetylglucosamine 2-epimerase (non-hydrolysing)
MRILALVGARPNLMKVAPILRALRRHGGSFRVLLVHTGQHYDELMSGSFFQALEMPAPDVNLAVGSGSHAQQTALVMMRLEPVLIDFAPDLVMVVGDVNSTLAGALTAKKLGIRVAHVEAGLRSFDMSMPEEINRVCTDAIADDLFTTDRMADANLLREGVAAERIHFVGNVMIDSLIAHRELAASGRYFAQLGLQARRYATLTLHRPANVEAREKFAEILDALSEVAAELPILFPIHPRTRQRVEEFGFQRFFGREPGGAHIYLTEPLGYLEFLNLNIHAQLVLTDSGGLQEETTILGVPCVTLRENTEWPITITEGTNRLGGTSRRSILAAVEAALDQPLGAVRCPEKWDGKASDRIADIISQASVISNQELANNPITDS